MKPALRWKRGALSNTYEIFEDENLIGKLKDSAFSKTSEGIIREKGYQFKTQGLFKQETQIIDAISDQLVGTIRYSSWKSRANIRLKDQVYQWTYENMWQTRWSLLSEDVVQVSYAGGSSKGTITCFTSDDLLILTGLFVTNYYRQIGVAIMVAVFLPILLTTLQNISLSLQVETHLPCEALTIGAICTGQEIALTFKSRLRTGISHLWSDQTSTKPAHVTRTKISFG